MKATAESELCSTKVYVYDQYTCEDKITMDIVNYQYDSLMEFITNDKSRH